MNHQDVKAFLEDLPFVRLIGIELSEIGNGYAEGDLEMREELSWDSEELRAHGGVTFTLAETTGAAAIVASNEPPVFTVDMRVEYLSPSVGDLQATAEVIRERSTLGVVDVKITDERGERVALSNAVYRL